MQFKNNTYKYFGYKNVLALQNTVTLVLMPLNFFNRQISGPHSTIIHLHTLELFAVFRTSSKMFIESFKFIVLKRYLPITKLFSNTEIKPNLMSEHLLNTTYA